MDTYEILIAMFKLSGKDKKQLIQRSELPKTTVYEVLSHDLPWKEKKKPQNHRFEFVQAWIATTRPSDPLKRLEWAALAVKLVLSDEDLDDLLNRKVQRTEIEQQRPVQSFVSNFVPEFFLSLFRMRKDK